MAINNDNSISDYGKLDIDEVIAQYDEDIVDMAIEEFVTETYQKLKTQVPEAYNKGDYNQLRDLTHKFKTGSGYIGAIAFSKLCHTIQIACKEEVINKEKIAEYYKIFMENLDVIYKQCKEIYEKKEQKEEEGEDLEKNAIEFVNNNEPNTVENEKIEVTAKEEKKEEKDIQETIDKKKNEIKVEEKKNNDNSNNINEASTLRESINLTFDNVDESFENQEIIILPPKNENFIYELQSIDYFGFFRINSEIENNEFRDVNDESQEEEEKEKSENSKIEDEDGDGDGDDNTEEEKNNNEEDEDDDEKDYKKKEKKLLGKYDGNNENHFCIII